MEVIFKYFEAIVLLCLILLSAMEKTYEGQIIWLPLAILTIFWYL